MSTQVHPLRALCRVVLPRRIRHHLLIASYWSTPAGRRHVKSYFLNALGRHLQEVSFPHGKFFVDIRDRGVGWPIYVQQEYEPTERLFIEATVKPGMVAYDIGTNIGFIAAQLGRLVGPGGRVIGFEPDPYNYALATRNIEHNALGNVRVFNCALGAEFASMKLYPSTSNFGDHRMYASEDRQASIDVTVERLEDLVHREQIPLPDFIKIDVQGFEYKVFQGADKLLALNRDLTILTEYWPYGIRSAGDDPIAYRQKFIQSGFKAYRLDSVGSLVDVDWDSIDYELAPERTQDVHVAAANIVFRKTAS